MTYFGSIEVDLNSVRNNYKHIKNIMLTVQYNNLNTINHGPNFTVSIVDADSCSNVLNKAEFFTLYAVENWYKYITHK